MPEVLTDVLPDAMPEVLLELRGVGKRFGGAGGLSRLLGEDAAGVLAVDDVSLSLARGEVLGLVGESGSGKSTLARLAVGLLPLSCGQRLWRGQDLDALPAAEKRRRQLAMQMVFQDPYASLNPRMKVIDLLGEAPRVHGQVSRAGQAELVEKLLHQVGLDAAMMQRYPHQFSGGQRARLGIARALALQPELLVCDESVAALDVSIQAQVLDLLMDLRRELGLTCLFISHDLAVVRHVSDRVAVMFKGRIVELAMGGELFEHPLHPYTQMLLASAPRLQAKKMDYRVAQTARPRPEFEATQSERQILTEARPGHWVAKPHNSP
jgi:peptide/nickel transport system ATP-binding protein